jgi:hypothetical protein
MAVCDHPIARAQDLIDRLKNLTRPIGEAESKDLNALWNELEDLLIMLAIPAKYPVDGPSKADTLRIIIAAIDDYRETEKRDADSDKEPGGITEHRRSSHGDSAGHERRPGETGHTGTETDQGSEDGAAGSD